MVLFASDLESLDRREVRLALGEVVADLAQTRLGRGDEGRANVVRRDESALLEHPFAGCRVRLDEEQVDERVKAVVDLARALDVAGLPQLVHACVRRGRDVRRGAEESLTAQGEQRQAEQLD